MSRVNYKSTRLIIFIQMVVVFSAGFGVAG